LAYILVVEFDWDPDKDVQNQRKHGVSFAEASQLLCADADRLEIFDRHHSEDEDRFITIGPTQKGILVVVWTERDDQTIRLISARAATRREQTMYLAHLEEQRE
jgi:uncharacterized DUF497 family protein